MSIKRILTLLGIAGLFLAGWWYISASEYKYTGCDLSHHNKLTRNDWHALRDKGVTFAYIKASDGSSFKDRLRFKHTRNAREMGMEVGYYHFFRDHIPAEKQFRNFKAATEGLGMDLQPVIDYEREGFKKDKKARIKRLRSLVKLFQKEYNGKVVIYCNQIEYLQLKPLFPSCTFWIPYPTIGKAGSIHQRIEKIKGMKIDINRATAIPRLSKE